MKILIIFLISILIALRYHATREALASLMVGVRAKGWKYVFKRADRSFLFDHEYRGMETFAYHAGEPVGYAGFTDYNAMRSDLNNRLRKLPIDEQYWLVGFGVGFAQGVLDHCLHAYSDDVDRTLKLPDLDVRLKAAISWLALLQKEGTDNAFPSTRNLVSGLLATRKELAERGPIRVEYWQKSLRESREPTFPADPLLKGTRVRKMTDAQKLGEDVAATLSMVNER